MTSSSGQEARTDVEGRWEVHLTNLDGYWDIHEVNGPSTRFMGLYVGSFAIANCIVRDHADAQALRTRVEALEGALKEYGDHHGDCPAVQPVDHNAMKDRFNNDTEAMLAWLRSDEFACTCGFDAALTGNQEEGA